MWAIQVVLFLFEQLYLSNSCHHLSWSNRRPQLDGDQSSSPDLNQNRKKRMKKRRQQRKNFGQYTFFRWATEYFVAWYPGRA